MSSGESGWKNSVRLRPNFRKPFASRKGLEPLWNVFCSCLFRQIPRRLSLRSEDLVTRKGEMTSAKSMYRHSYRRHIRQSGAVAFSEWVDFVPSDNLSSRRDNSRHPMGSPGRARFEIIIRAGPAQTAGDTLLRTATHTRLQQYLNEYINMDIYSAMHRRTLPANQAEL